MSDKQEYRPDIDGLRAVAFLAVYLFHLGVSATPGGFIGVDIFLVISGYVMGKHIADSHLLKNFSWSTYLEQRARRLLPALLTLMVVVAIIGFSFINFPADRLQLGKTLISQTFFVSNFYFSGIDSYFDISLKDNLLLHTWTLALEIQFYVLLPLLLWLWVRRNYLLYIAIGASFLLQLYLSWIATTNDPQFGIFNFYFIGSRLWEFLVGVWLSQITLAKTTYNSFSMSTLGLLLLLWSMVTIEPSVSYPGLLAVIPVLGTALLIYSGKNNSIISTVLSSSLFTYIGKRSYGLYLWHWPIIVLASMIWGTLHILTILVSTTLTLLIAMGSYTYIETPIRSKQWLVSSKLFVFIMALVSAIVILCGYLLIKTVPIEKNAEQMYRTLCSSTICSFGDEATFKKTIFLWGDSHALMVAPLIDYLGQQYETRIIAVITPSCGIPLIRFGESVFTTPSRTDCDASGELAREVLSNYSIDSVLLIARWTAYTKYWDDGGTTSVTLKSQEQNESSIYENELVHTMQFLQSKQIPVFIMKSIPRMTEFDKSRKSTSRILLSEYEAEWKTLPNIIRTPSSSNITLLDPLPLLCTNKSCIDNNNNVELYRDAGHLSRQGICEIAPIFSSLFANYDSFDIPSWCR